MLLLAECFIKLKEPILDPYYTGCSLNIVFFLKMLWFFLTLPVLLQCRCLTCHCVHTLTTPRGNREWPESGIYFKIFEKSAGLLDLEVILKMLLADLGNQVIRWGWLRPWVWCGPSWHQGSGYQEVRDYKGWLSYARTLRYSRDCFSGFHRKNIDRTLKSLKFAIFFPTVRKSEITLYI